MHSLDLLNSLLEREFEKLLPPHPLLLLPHRTFALMEPLLKRLRLDLVASTSDLQIADCSSEVDAALGLDEDLSAQGWSQLQFHFARGELLRHAFLVVFARAGAEGGDVLGNGVIETAAATAAGSVCGCAAIA